MMPEIWRVAEATVKKNSCAKARKCAAQTLHFSAHSEKHLEGTLPRGVSCL